jgi:RNA polymerase sigma-70 factor (ECF subfamily)
METDRAMHAPENTRDQPGAAPSTMGGDPSMMSSDESILAAIGRRDDYALATLYDRYGRVAFALAYRVLGERGAAEDVVQEAFLSVWRYADRYRPERGAPRAWLMTIVHHAAIDRHRGRYKREQRAVALDDVAFALEADGQDTFDVVAEGIDAERIRDAVGSLPREQQEAIELAFFSGLTHQEISDRTGTPLGTIKGRMRLGLTKLRTRLTENGEVATVAL